MGKVFELTFSVLDISPLKCRLEQLVRLFLSVVETLDQTNPDPIVVSQALKILIGCQSGKNEFLWDDSLNPKRSQICWSWLHRIKLRTCVVLMSWLTVDVGSFLTFVLKRDTDIVSINRYCLLIF